MADREKTRRMLEKLAPGTEITIRLQNGELVKGSFQGLDGDQVQIDHDGEQETHDVARLETVAMDLSSAGPE